MRLNVAEAVDETVAFLRWLLDLNFVFLGYREYDLVDAPGGRALVVAPGSGLGILAKEDWSSHHRPTPLASIPEGVRVATSTRQCERASAPRRGR